MAKKTKIPQGAVSKQTPAAIKATASSDQRPLVLQIAFWGLAALLFVTPFFRGLFFAEEQYKALVFAAALFWLVFFGRWTQRNYRVFEHPLDYLMLGLPLVYIYSAFFAVNTGLAVTEVAKNVLYFLVFWVTVRLVRSDKDANQLLKVVYYAAIAVALAGLATATGIISIKDGFNVSNGQMSSTFQYHNALASYLGATFLLGLYLWQRAVDRQGRLDQAIPFALPEWLAAANPKPYLYVLGNTLLAAVFLGAQSNGAFFVFAVVSGLFLLGLGKGRRLQALWHFVLTFVPGLTGIALFLRSVANQQPDLAWLWILLALILAVALQAATDFYNRSLNPRLLSRRNTLIAGVAGLTVLGLGLAGMWVATNQAFVERITAALRWHNFQHRINYIGDALEMITARPFTGWGGGGWQEAYQSYLDYHFVTRQVHGHYAQVGVETGILGILIYVSILGVLFWTAHRLYWNIKDDPSRRRLVWVVFAAVLALGLHATIDFDLSLSAIALLLWSLMGVLVGLALAETQSAAETRRPQNRSSWAPLDNSRLVLSSLAILIVAVFGLTLALSSSFNGLGTARLNRGDVNGGIGSLQRAAAYNPFDPDIHDLLARAYNARGDLDLARKEAERAAALSEFDPRRYQLLASLAAAEGDAEDAEKYAEKAIAVAPLDVRQYETLAQTYLSLSLTRLSQEKLDQARAYRDKVLQVPGQMEERMTAVSEDDLSLWSGPRLQPRPELQLNLGIAYCLRGEYKQAVANLDPARKHLQDQSAKGQALVWSALTREKQGQTEETQALQKEAEKLNPKLKDLYDSIRNLPIPI